MWLSDFDYNLPKELIAQYPLDKRDDSRLMVLDRRTKRIAHKKFFQIADYFENGDLLILNNTKVLPARVFGVREKTGAKIEFLLLKREGNIFSVMVKPAKKFEQGEAILFDDNNGGFKAKIVEKGKIAFEQEGIDKVYQIGTMPLPPYIKRQSKSLDFERYQTIFAKTSGSIAAPTAGLHFTEELLGKVSAKGVLVDYVTLHVGTGTFKPVKAEDVISHEMEPEYFEVEAKLIEKISEAKRAGGRVFAVGSTSCRVLEEIGDLPATHKGYTNLFIYPGYQFKAVDCLLTNFHLPKSTLFMLVCAFCAAGASDSVGAGIELIKSAYNEAIKEKYRFYSYGDAMLIV
ncbi:MAG: tRNA preQ1(34) S-adenosylmethionine ribosyltransferase-isomerase QueA [Candidatus Omnitrophota bacterium]|nr:tRNA preQ1(34) S-adenosylmethionine ribosyltransferase-isomerase QueA [Candidatus Omnitrophota bacterium]